MVGPPPSLRTASGMATAEFRAARRFAGEPRGHVLLLNFTQGHCTAPVQHGVPTCAAAWLVHRQEHTCAGADAAVHQIGKHLGSLPRLLLAARAASGAAAHIGAGGAVWTAGLVCRVCFML